MYYRITYRKKKKRKKIFVWNIYQVGGGRNLDGHHGGNVGRCRGGVFGGGGRSDGNGWRRRRVRRRGAGGGERYKQCEQHGERVLSSVFHILRALLPRVKGDKWAREGFENEKNTKKGSERCVETTDNGSVTVWCVAMSVRGTCSASVCKK